MPELPEVETTRLGILPHLIDQQVCHIELRDRRMRWPVTDEPLQLIGQNIQQVGRRAKYLLIQSEPGTLLLHLGMSGSLRLCLPETPLRKHDHFILQLASGQQLRLHDPRRFGSILWHSAAAGDINQHPRLCQLGPEPLSETFTPKGLIASCAGRTTSIKQHIMSNATVVGVGNIYASEALYRSQIHPKRSAGRISEKRLTHLHQSIRDVLTEAIAQGGTTLRDFLHEDGQPGYFKQKLEAYDRENLPCRRCTTSIKKIQISGRASYYCPHCQR